jgi:hypothetical protein
MRMLSINFVVSQVYDVTKFLKNHPGAENVLLHVSDIRSIHSMFILKSSILRSIHSMFILKSSIVCFSSGLQVLMLPPVILLAVHYYCNFYFIYNQLEHIVIALCSFKSKFSTTKSTMLESCFGLMM